MTSTLHPPTCSFCQFTNLCLCFWVLTHLFAVQLKEVHGICANEEFGESREDVHPGTRPKLP